LPAQLIQPTSGRAVWLLEKDAASRISNRKVSKKRKAG